MKVDFLLAQGHIWHGQWWLYHWKWCPCDFENWGHFRDDIHPKDSDGCELCGMIDLYHEREEYADLSLIEFAAKMGVGRRGWPWG